MLHQVCIWIFVLSVFFFLRDFFQLSNILFPSLGIIVKYELKTRSYLHYKNSQIVSKQNHCTHHKKKTKRPNANKAILHVVWTQLAMESVVTNSNYNSAQ